MRPTWITIDGERKRLCDWCREYGITKQAVIDRVKRGQSVEVAITKQVRRYLKRSEIGTDAVSEQSS